MKEKCDDLEASLEQLKSELTELKALYKEKETEIANQEVQLQVEFSVEIFCHIQSVMSFIFLSRSWMMPSLMK
jgi:hypothetical protein